MIKIIWSKEELSSLEDKLNQQDIHYLVLDDAKSLPKEMIGIQIDDLNQDEFKKIIDMIEYEKMQMFFPTHEGFVQIHLKDILYVESFKDDIYMHMMSHSVEHIKKPLYQLEDLLNPYHFIRISKSYIVNIRMIQYIKVGLNAKLHLELKEGTKLDVTRSFVKSFKKSLNL
jgi:DNA-binding LytR/AlgR family response regulator